MKILYFAWVKDKIGKSSEDIDLPSHILDLEGLMDYLSSLSGGHAEAFQDKSQLRIAKDKQYALPAEKIGTAREIAFFPPVTGG